MLISNNGSKTRCFIKNTDSSVLSFQDIKDAIIIVIQNVVAIYEHLVFRRNVVILLLR